MTNSPQPSNQAFTPFELLRFRVADAHWKWKVWKQLFMGDRAKPEESEARIVLMNSVAPHFFAMLKDLIFAEIVLLICKLVDREQFPRKKPALPRRNLSLRAALVDQSGRLSTPELGKAEGLIEDFAKACEPLVTWRTWRIAHDDYLMAIGGEKLPPLSDTDVDRAMTSAVEIMTLLDPDSKTCTYAYGNMIADGDGDALLYALRRADEHRKQCRAERMGPRSSGLV